MRKNTSKPSELTQANKKSNEYQTLQITPVQWKDQGWRILTEHSRSQFEVGDWLNLRVKGFEDQSKYEAAAKILQLSAKTLRNHAYVAREFSKERRNEKVPFSIYVELAAFTREKQDELINQYLTTSLTCEEIRAMRKSPPVSPKPYKIKSDGDITEVGGNFLTLITEELASLKKDFDPEMYQCLCELFDTVAFQIKEFKKLKEEEGKI